MKVNSAVWSDPLCKMKWHTDIGHELTFLPKAPVKHRELKTALCDYNSFPTDIERKYMDDIDDIVERIGDKFLAKDIPTHRLMRDVHCVEVSSDLLTSWQELVVWNEMVRYEAGKLKLKPEVDWIGGGMGHQHIDLMVGLEAANLFRLVAARPYLAWVFLTYEDDKNAVTHASRYLVNEDFELSEKLYFTPDNDDFYIFNGKDANHFYDHRDATNERGCVLTYRNGGSHWEPETIEWRAFDAAPTIEQQIEHTAFLQALVGHAKKQKTLLKPVLSSVNEAKGLLKRYGQGSRAFDRSAKEFLAFIKELGLPTSRYEKYVETNLRQRIAHGNPI